MPAFGLDREQIDELLFHLFFENGVTTLAELVKNLGDSFVQRFPKCAILCHVPLQFAGPQQAEFFAFSRSELARFPAADVCLKFVDLRLGRRAIRIPVPK